MDNRIAEGLAGLRIHGVFELIRAVKIFGRLSPVPLMVFSEAAIEDQERRITYVR